MLDFPEGIELYKVVVAHPDADRMWFDLWLHDHPPCQGSVPDPQVIEVRRMRGHWGWSEELRVLVCFNGAPLPIFELNWITNADIALECAAGDRLLSEQRMDGNATD